jgi:hypothetical protein
LCHFRVSQCRISQLGAKERVILSDSRLSSQRRESTPRRRFFALALARIFALALGYVLADARGRQKRGRVPS